jgi:hypothetical protein
LNRLHMWILLHNILHILMAGPLKGYVGLPNFYRGI